MGGILLYVYFLIIGFLYANELFSKKDMFTRAWLGGVFGNVILMAGMVVPSLISGFTPLSHIILAVICLVPYAAVKLRKKITGFKEFLYVDVKPEDAYMDWRVFCALIIPVTLIICVLMSNHILAPYKDGGYASGQCTYGDLQMHLSFVTSIAEQQEFPPEYSLLAGTTMNYPFFVDMLSSSLFQFGTGLRTAVLLPSYMMALLTVMGFYILAFKITKRKSAAVIATVLFFVGGGFGFMYFLDGAKEHPEVYERIFTDFYRTPTNYNTSYPAYWASEINVPKAEWYPNIRWVNPICDMIIPQRTTMAGWCTLLPALWMLLEALKTREFKLYIVLGIFAGCMPMIHTHSFLGLGLICAVLFFAHLFEPREAEAAVSKTGESFLNEDRKAYMKEYFIHWVIFGAIAIGLAFPQLFMWTFKQTTGNDSFLKPQFNWVNHTDPYWWFYVKNWGITALFAIPAIWWASKDNKKLLAGCVLIFILAETVLFQPNEYDNNKLFFIVYMILIMVMSGWLMSVWDAMKATKGRVYLAVLIIFAGTYSGALSLWREYKSGAQYQTFTEDDIKMAEYIKENTPANAVFLTGTGHLNPVCTLSGRTIYDGSSLYVYYHGMGDEYYKRKTELEAAYKGSYENMKNFCEEHGIEYIYVGRDERGTIKPNQTMLSEFEPVYSAGTNTLYKVN